MTCVHYIPYIAEISRVFIDELSPDVVENRFKKLLDKVNTKRFINEYLTCYHNFTCLIVLLSGSKSLLSVSSNPDAMPSPRQPFIYRM